MSACEWDGVSDVVSFINGGQSRSRTSLNLHLFRDFYFTAQTFSSSWFYNSLLHRRSTIFASHQSVKLPILKWSKHGATTISLPDIQYVVGADFVLLCGDIHPHPGPRPTLKPSVNMTTIQANKCSTTQDSRNRNHWPFSH